MTGRQELIKLYIQYAGDWHSMYKAIKNHEVVDDTVIEDNDDLITIFDADYPEWLKELYQPPFVATRNQMRGLIELHDYLMEIKDSLNELAILIDRVDEESNKEEFYKLMMQKKTLNDEYDKLWISFNKLCNRVDK